MLAEITRHCGRRDLSLAEFGRRAAGDPGLAAWIASVDEVPPAMLRRIRREMRSAARARREPSDDALG